MTMRKNRLPYGAALLSFLALFASASCTNDSDEGADGRLRVGFARVDVTPDVPVKLAGYGTFFGSEENCRWSTGVHDPLYAQAVAVDDPGGAAPVILVILDVIGLIVGDIDMIRAGIADAVGIEERSVVVASTHTHHSHDTIGLWGVLLPPVTGRQEEVVQQTLTGAIRAGIEAWDARVPATLEFGVGVETGLHENIIYEDPERTIDDTMTLVAAHDQEGGLLGTIMNWACHPTIMGQESTLISSDFAGAYYRIMGEDLGGVHLYVNGVIGAMVQPVINWLPPEPESWDEVDRAGRILADDAQALLAGATPIEGPVVGFLENRSGPVRLWNPLYMIIARLGLMDIETPHLGGTAETFITTFSLGPVLFGTLPGEFVPDYGHDLRDIMGGEAQVLVGIGMDYLGYVLTPRQFRNAAYTYERMICVGPRTGEQVLDIYEGVYGK